MSDIWLTPRWLLSALGGPDSIDLDPCASLDQPWRTARRQLTIRDDGLTAFWAPEERAFLNMPYSNVRPWIERLIAHGRGTALMFAKTDTRAFAGVFDTASALFFLQGRVRFHLPDGSPAPERAKSPSVLCAWGEDDADILFDCGVQGRFVPLNLPRRFAVMALEPTWREAVEAWLRRHNGPVRLSELYQAFAHHPKARRARHYREKLRQTLQRGPFVRLAGGVWALAS